jgi:acetolactate synthase-1/3 small subunit
VNKEKARDDIMKKVVFSILMANTAGMLSRIAGLFTRRGYNIDSLTVGTTADPRFSRATIVSTGDDQVLGQIEAQLMKLEDVLDIKRLDSGSSVCRELLLLKIAANKNDRQEVISIANIFRANIIDVARESLVIELTGNQSKLEAFVSMLDGFEILELARTGITGLSRGTFDVKVPDKTFDETGKLVYYDNYEPDFE